eukprot:3300262-Pyramimonas_sp.AAC.1
MRKRSLRGIKPQSGGRIFARPFRGVRREVVQLGLGGVGVVALADDMELATGTACLTRDRAVDIQQAAEA